MAQACHFRVATKDARVGQPEVLLGIIPGAGGTQRLPRLAGAKLALEMSTDGKPVAAPKALAAGIIDHIVEGDLLTGAIAFAKSKAKAGEIRKVREIAISAEGRDGRTEACEAVRAALKKTARGMAAPFAAVNAIEAGLKLPFDEGSAASASSSPSAWSPPNRRRCGTCFLPSVKWPRSPTSRRTRRPETSSAPPSLAPAPWAAASR